MFDAEVISVGDEMTSGQRLDTNSQWLSQRLGELGVRTVRHTTVSDDLAASIEAFQQAADRVRFVIISGGLGPTLDDLTREAMSKAFDRPLELHPPSLEHIEKMFVRRQRPMPERNKIQAYLPAGSLWIPNPHGTAPGIDLSVSLTPDHRCRLFALPGVPAEMKQMWHESVVQRLESELGQSQGQLRYHAIKVYGIGESDVEVKLPTLIARSRIPTVGITVSRATITLRIAGRSQTEAEFQQLIEPTIEEIQAALGDLIFGEGEDELEHAVTRKLLESDRSLATLEIGCSSLVADWMLAVNGTLKSSGDVPCYAGGLAFPTVVQALKWLQASSSTSAGSEPVELSEAVCVELAARARYELKANIGLAFGVYPSEHQLAESSRVFEVIYGLSIDSPDGPQAVVEKRTLSGHPEVVTARIAKTALDIVRRHIT